MKNIILFCFFTIFFSNKQIIAQTKPQESIKKYKLHIRTYDSESTDNLEGTYIKLYNLTKKRLTDSALVIGGFANFTLDEGNNYDIIGQRVHYMTRRANFNAACYLQNPEKIFCVSGMNIEHLTKQADGSNFIEVGFAMKKIKLNDSFKFENIVYDLDKWAIRPDAAKELDNLVQILRDNPEILVELGSHTDSRSSDSYNLNLSQKRANSAVEYIIKKGKISQNRITSKGYGETKLLNKCGKSIFCSDLEHAINRRTEIKITGYSIDGIPVEVKDGTFISGDKQ